MEEFEKSIQGSNVILIRRLVITQSAGKKRIIDNAADGGQSEMSTDEKALCFCSAIQPAHHSEAIRSYLGHEGIPWPKGSEGCIQAAGEDWPDAYRYTPCVVAPNLEVRCGPAVLRDALRFAKRSHIVQQIVKVS